MDYQILAALPQAARRLSGRLKDIRRKLHQIPEPGFSEEKTSGFIAGMLAEMHIPFQDKIAGTGIVARIERGDGMPSVALRADIDALPISEQNDVPYRSRHEGCMHACGHDMHTACLLGALMLLDERKNALPVNVTAIFQPAEEKLPGGARRIIAEGVLSDYAVKAIFGLHVDPFLKTGAFAVKAGTMMASTAGFTITITGKGGHAAMPFKAVDPVLVAAHVITALQAVPGRMIDPLAPCVVTATQISAGSAFNIIPETAVIKGTARTLDPGTADKIPAYMERMIRGIAESYGAEYALDYVPGTPALVNDETMTGHVIATAVRLFGDGTVHDFKGTFGGEDCGDGSTGAAPLHHPRVNPDEEALIYGAAVLAGIALSFTGSDTAE